MSYLRKIYQRGGNLPDEKFLGPINFLNSYYNSPEFKKRYSLNNPASGYDAALKDINSRAGTYKPFVSDDSSYLYGSATRLPNTRTPEIDAAMQDAGIPSDANVIIDSNADNNRTLLKLSGRGNAIINPLTSVLPHEYSHLTRSLSNADRKFISKRNPAKGGDDEDSQHDADPQETYSDINALRYILYNQGVYDTRKGPLDLPTLKKALDSEKIKKDFSVDRLLRLYTPEKIVELNNSIGLNKTRSGLPIAQQGGKLPIYTSDPNDPRLRAYQDSLSLYNKTQKGLKNKKIESYQKPNELVNAQVNIGTINGKPNVTIKQVPLGQAYNNEPIKPIGFYNMADTHPKYAEEYTDGKFAPQVSQSSIVEDYKKPVQPVVYQKPPQSVPSKDNTAVDTAYNKKYPPIYLSDPKDPRIGWYTEKGNQWLYKKPQQAPVNSSVQPTYQDSLNLYNASKRAYDKDVQEKLKTNLYYYNRFMNNPSYSAEDKKNSTKPSINDFYKYAERSKKLTNKNLKTHQDEEGNHYYGDDLVWDDVFWKNRNNPIKPVSYSKGEDGIESMFYKKPVGSPQPQKPKYNTLQQTIPYSGPSTPNIYSQINTPKVSGEVLRTPYSFTYPTGPYNEQKTIYTPDLESWKRLIKDKRLTTSQQSSSGATATGYYKKGGEMKKYQTQGLVEGPELQANNNYDWMQVSPDLTGAPGESPIYSEAPPSRMKRSFDPLNPNPFGLGVMSAYLASQMLLNKSNDRNYEAYKKRWIRDYQVPSLLIDPNKHSSEYYESPIYDQGGCVDCMQDGGIHIKPSHRGRFTDYCGGKVTSDCIKRGKASSDPSVRKMATFAQNARGWSKQTGGLTLNTPEDQGQGYFKYPSASQLTFPGNGERTFVPGPFPLLVKDERGIQTLTNRPIKTRGTVIEMPMYQDGGEIRTKAVKVPRKDATIEAEKDEVIFGAGHPGNIDDQEDRVGAGLFKIGGQKHSQGGTPLKAYPGDFVFSNDKSLAFSEETAKDLVGDTIKNKSKRTPAKLAQKYLGLNKYIAMTQDKEVDPTSKKTAMLNINNFIDRLGEIAYAQEEQKGFPNGLPAFAQISIGSRGFDTEGLQGDLNQMKMGGEIAKFQTQGEVTDEIYRRAKKVTDIDPSYKLYGRRDNRVFYMKPDGSVVSAPDAAGGPQYKGNDYLGQVLAKSPKNLTQYPWSELSRQGYGSPDSKLGPIWDSNYYKGNQDYVYTELMSPQFPTVTNDLTTAPGNTKSSTNVPEDQLDLTGGNQTSLNNYVSLPNTKFNLNLAEAYGLTSALRPYESRYPTAFRTSEIQNAKSQIASSYRPISEQPYLNAIKRQRLGFEQNNNPYGATGFTRGLAGYTGALNAENQAIGQVYAQNLSRSDQQAALLANLEVQDGTDRVANGKEYDTKLETLNNNKELAKKYRAANVSNILNQMTSDRMSMGLYNQMSDYYQINPDYSFGIKPTYRIDNGKLVPVQRNIGDLVRSQQSSNAQYNPALMLANDLEKRGYTRDQIARILSRTVDDYDKNR